MAGEAGLAVDEAGFRALMQEQRQRAQADSREKKSGHADLSVFHELLSQGETVFTGYQELDGDSRVRAILAGGHRVDRAGAGDQVEIVLAETPFYAEAGGQAADTGLITGDGFVVEVLDVQRPVKGLSVHKAVVREGELPADALVRAAVDRQRRHAAEQAHTGTHIVHAALHQILGPEALQRGSFNKAGYLRFDFAWGEGLSYGHALGDRGSLQHRHPEQLPGGHQGHAAGGRQGAGRHGAVRRKLRFARCAWWRSTAPGPVSCAAARTWPTPR